jgi:hypothetical protein
VSTSARQTWEGYEMEDCEPMTMSDQRGKRAPHVINREGGDPPICHPLVRLLELATGSATDRLADIYS